MKRESIFGHLRSILWYLGVNFHHLGLIFAYPISFAKLKRIKCCHWPYNLPSGSSANLTARHEVPSLMGWDGMGWDGMGRSPKVSFNFIHIQV